MRKQITNLTIHDDAGRVICNAAELNSRNTEHFGRQFSDPALKGLPTFVGRSSRFPITEDEIKRAIGKFNDSRASGHDDIPTELMKCTAGLLACTIAGIFSDALERK